MTRVTLENENGLYIIESPDDQMTVCDMYETFFNPIMLAATYQQPSIEDYFVQKASTLEDVEDFDKECECEECSRK